MKNIVLIHGWGANSQKLLDLQQILVNNDWDVLNIKLPGFEEAPPKKPWSLNDYCDFVYKSASKYFDGKNFYMFGHSFGGRIAIKCAYNNYPLLKGIILCSSSGLSRGNIAKRIIFKTLSDIGRRMGKENAIFVKWRTVIYRLAREHDYEKTEGTMRETFKNIITEDLRPYVTRITLPSLILWGRSDKMTPYKDALFLRKHLSNSKLFDWNNEGHRLPYNKPEEVAMQIILWERSMIS